MTFNHPSAFIKTAVAPADSDDYPNSHFISPESAPRYRPEPPCPPKHVLLHYSAFRLLWDWTILLLTGYTAVVVPLRLAVIPRPTWIVPLDESANTDNNKATAGPMSVSDNFAQLTTIPDKLAIVDAVIDVIFGLDIVLNFHTSFVGAGGEVVADPPVIRINYLSGWFTLDLISCLPYEIIKYFWTATNKEIYGLLDSLRIVRLLRIGRAARRIDQYLEYVSTLLLLMIVCFFLLAHWFACAWYAVGIYDLDKQVYHGWIPRYFNDSLNPQNWRNFSRPDPFIVPVDHIGSRSLVKPGSSERVAMESAAVAQQRPKRLPLYTAKDRWSAYITALYFSLSLLTTIGFGNVAAFTEVEKLLCIVCMMIGALVYATIFGNVTTIVQQMYSTRTRYNDIMKGVKDFLRIHEVPQELGERVIDYITSSWSVTKGIDTAKVLNYCPKDMQADISVHLNRSVFNTHPAFRLASDGCKRSLAVNFNTLHTAPGDLIFHQGESVDQLCFISSGTLEVLQDDEVVAILSKGDVFGDPAWKNPESIPSAASVRALTYCTLQTIRLERLRSVLQFYHAFANSFTRNLELTYNLSSRIIFRKLADVKRELELSMRQNKDPPLSNIPSDHPLRKLISRLRRPSQAGDNMSGRCLSAKFSGDSSLDGSELDNSSLSMSNATTDSERRRISSRLSTMRISQQQSLQPASTAGPIHGLSGASTPGTDSPEHARQSAAVDPGESAPLGTANRVPMRSILSVNRAGGGQTSAAKRWARLMTKATQSRLQNVSEVSEEPNNSNRSQTSESQSAMKIRTEIKPEVTATQEPVCNSTDRPPLVKTQTDALSPDVGKLIEAAVSQAISRVGTEFQSHLIGIYNRLQGIEDQFKEIRQSVAQPSSLGTSRIVTSTPGAVRRSQFAHSKDAINNSK